MEKLSISIPTRNRCVYLRELLESIKMQGVTTPEILEILKIYIFDNDSDDGTEEMVKMFDLPILYKKNEENIGVQRNIFQAYTVPNGQYIWVMGDDELLPPGSIARILSLVNEYEPALILNKDKDYNTFVEVPLVFNDYYEFAVFAVKYNPHLILAHTLISANVIKKECFDVEYALKYEGECYSQMFAISSGLKKHNGKVIQPPQTNLIVREQRPQYDGISANDSKKIRKNGETILKGQITYLKWLKKLYNLQGLIPERVVPNYNLRLYPNIAKVTVIINVVSKTEMLENKIRATIESILRQSYSNIEIVVTTANSLREINTLRIQTDYGNAVRFIDVSLLEKELRFKSEEVQGEYILVLNVGDCLLDIFYLSDAVKIMSTNSDIDIVCANFIQCQSKGNDDYGKFALQLPEHFLPEAWTKITGKSFFLNYDKLWCAPCTTVVRYSKFPDITKCMSNYNEIAFLWMLLDTNLAFYNTAVATTTRKPTNTLKDCYKYMEGINLAANEAVQRGCAQADAVVWRENMLKIYFYDILRQKTNESLLLGLFDLAQQAGVAKLVYSAAITRIMNLPSARFLFIKSWGCGMWADIDHVLGQLLLAELMHRTPIVYWGKESLYYHPKMQNAFDKYFIPVSNYSINEVINEQNRYFPNKWTKDNILERDTEKYAKPYTEKEIYDFFERPEEVIVNETHISLEMILKYLRPGHELYGLDTLQVTRYLIKKYLKLQSELKEDIDNFYLRNMEGKKIIAVHVRAGDRTESLEKLQSNNRLYYAKIAEFVDDSSDCLIFLMTDSEYVLHEFKMLYGAKLIYMDCHRTNKIQGIHYDPNIVDKYKIGKEAIIDVYLAAKCDYFIGCNSNVSAAVLRLKDWKTENVYCFKQLPSTVL